ERRAEELQEWLAEREQRRCIESAHPKTSADLIDTADAVSADDLTTRDVPDEQLLVVIVEQVDVRAVSRALAHRAKAQLAQTAELLQRPRDLTGIGAIDFLIAR